jgi:hypothetical protein
MVTGVYVGRLVLLSSMLIHTLIIDMLLEGFLLLFILLLPSLTVNVYITSKSSWIEFFNLPKLHWCTPVLTCMQAPLPEVITLDGSEVQQSAEYAWIIRNLGRIRHIILRADDAALSTNLAAATALQSLVVSECSTLQQLPVGCGGLQQLTSLHFDRW